MIVYVAQTEKDYKKVMNFIKYQPEGSVPRACFQAPGMKGRFIEELRTTHPNLQILVVEDDAGKIHVVSFADFVDYDHNGEIVKMSTNLAMIIDHQDFEKKDWSYLTELYDYNIKNYWTKKNIRFTQLTVPEVLFDLAKGFWGEAMEIVRTYDFPTSISKYLVRVDNKKYLERNR